MERDERYEVNSKGEIVVGTPVTLTPSERKDLIQKMFSKNGWKYTVLQEISQSHFHIRLENNNLDFAKDFHLYHGNIRKEDPERNREEKKIQLGTDNDPRDYKNDALILGFYVYDSKDLSDVVVVAWPVEDDKNYPANPSLRVNMRTDVLPAKNTGYYIDKTTGKNLIAFRPEFVFHYIENYKKLQYSSQATNQVSDIPQQNTEIVTNGSNVLLYGVPGSGKSWTIEHEYCKEGTIVERLVFHPDYTYSDFIGQILPCVEENGQVTYKFTPGPFTNILKDAFNNPTVEYVLVIEEINRGNAPAIFGEVFQLLDRKVEISDINDDGLPIGTSEYGITNANMARIIYDDPTHKVRIPSNLSIIGTMNTSDQNVFTLDTAFQRRWNMRLIENNFDEVDDSFAKATILDTTVTWEKFCVEINKIIIGNNARMTSSEDKRLGVYFIHLRDLLYDDRAKENFEKEFDDLKMREKYEKLSAEDAARLREIRDARKQNRKFPEKVIKYLWDDAFKYNREVIFETGDYPSLESVIRYFINANGNDRFKIFKENVIGAFNPTNN